MRKTSQEVTGNADKQRRDPSMDAGLTKHQNAQWDVHNVPDFERE